MGDRIPWIPDDRRASDTGRGGSFQQIERGAIYFTPKTGTHSVHGKIYEKWAEHDYEKGDLGYPTSSEYEDKGQRRSDFERGSITWDPQTDVVGVTLAEK